MKPKCLILFSVLYILLHLSSYSQNRQIKYDLAGQQKGEVYVAESGNIYLFGWTLPGTNRDGLIVRLDSDLSVLWSKRLSTSNNEIVESIYEKANGEIIALLNASNYERTRLVRIGNLGTILTSKRLGNSDDRLTLLHKTNSNDLLTYGAIEGLSGTQQNMPGLAILDSTNLSFSNRTKVNIGSDYSSREHYSRGLAEFSDNTFILVTQPTLTNSTNATLRLSKFDASFNVLWTKGYSATLKDAFREVYKYSSDSLVICGLTRNSSQGGDDALIMTFDSTGALSMCSSFGGLQNDVFNDVVRLPDNNFLVVGETSSYGSGNRDGLMVKISPSGSLIWARTYGSTGNDFFNNIQKSGDSLLISGVFAANNSNSTQDIYLITLDSLGNTNDTCWQDVTNSIGSSNSSRTQSSHSYTTNIFSNSILNNIAISNIVITDTVHCMSCDTTFSLPPDTAICLGESVSLSLSSSYNFIQWWDSSNSLTQVIDSNRMYWVTIKDSLNCIQSDTISLTVNTPNANFLGSSPFICDGDSFFVSILPSLSVVSLPNQNPLTSFYLFPGDTVIAQATDSNGCAVIDTIIGRFVHEPVSSGDVEICPNDSAQLSISAFNANTFWSSGQNGSSIWVFSPGSYSYYSIIHGCFFYDTIDVSYAGFETFNQLDDTMICPSDTILISADPDAFQFQWSNNAPSSNLLIYSDTTLSITYTDSLGCLSYDTIMIGTHPNISSAYVDTTLCSYDSITFNPSGNYLIYQNGLISDSILYPGSFVELVGADSNGCNIDTTFSIGQISAPIKSNDTLICRGDVISIGVSSNMAHITTWQDGSNGDSILIDSAGVYTASTIISHCNFNSVIKVEDSSPISPNLPDTILCPNTQLPLSLDTDFNYSWSHGASGSNILITNPGTYIVTISDSIPCFIQDTFVVDQMIALNPIGDQIKCPSDSILVQSNLPYNNLWSTGAQSQSIYISNPGIYYVVNDSLGCNQTDTFIVSNLSPANNTLPDTIQTCEDTTLYLFGWEHLGEDELSIDVSIFTSQQIILTTSENGCLFVDSIYVNISEISAFPTQVDTILCNQSTILNSPAPELDNLWSNGSEESFITISQPGDYSVNIIDPNTNCSTTVTYTVLLEGDIPTIISARDSMLCDTAASHFPGQIQWENEAGQSVDYPESSGFYCVNYTGECKVYRNCLFITMLECGCKIYVPTAFTPDRTAGINDIFIPISDNCQFTFWIFDRWGNEVFKGDELNGWNGKIANNESLQQENYVWKVLTDGGDIIFGRVLLIINK